MSMPEHQERVDSLLLYLARHSQHIKSLQLQTRACLTPESPLLGELPPGLQLERLSLTGLRLQLLPGTGRASLLPPGGPIKQLEIIECRLCDSEPDAALAQALSQLPHLQHLRYSTLGIPRFLFIGGAESAAGVAPFPGHVLSGLQELKYLDMGIADSDALEFVHLAPGLQDLKASYRSVSSTGSKLSALQQLTSLQLRQSSQGTRFDPAGLANKRHSRHLKMECCGVAGRPAGVAALLSQLQQMTQVTHLALPCCWRLPDGAAAASYLDGPPAAAYTALTASSTLLHLDISGNIMPQGVWQHVLSADRQLPQLQVLRASQHGMLGCWAHADTMRLASCCRNLQDLNMPTRVPMAADVLHPLHSLQQLTVLEAGELDVAGCGAAAVLTQLSKLSVWLDDDRAHIVAGMLPLTCLQG